MSRGSHRSADRVRLAPREVHRNAVESIGHHVTMRLADDRPLVTSSAARRIAASALLRVGDSLGLLAFAIADTHVHVLVSADRLHAGECARRIEISLQRCLAPRVRFQPARIQPVQDQAHLQNAFLYVLRQLERHGLDVDPAHDGTALPDLVGLRVTGSRLEARVAALLPRVDLGTLAGALVIASHAAAPDLSLLADAAAAAFGLAHLTATGLASARARFAAAHATEHLQADVVADLLGVSASLVRRLRKRPPSPTEVRAVQLQLRLRSSIADRTKTRLGAGP